MRKRIILLPAAFFIMLLAVSVSASPIVYSGIVKVDTVEAEPGDYITVNVNLLNNDIDISGLTIPLKYHSSHLSVDTVLFEGTLKPENTGGVYYVDEENRILKISYLPSIQSGSSVIPSFSDSDGLLATIRFLIDTDITNSFIPIDSMNIDSVITICDPPVHYWQRLEFSDATGQYYYLPDYIPGGIIVSGSTGVEDIASGLPSEFSLSQNYPNPFNPSTVIEFALPKAGHVELTIFNVLGQTVTTLLDRQMAAGNHQIEFDASNMPSGIYFYRLNHSEGSTTKKMILVK